LLILTFTLMLFMGVFLPVFCHNGSQCLSSRDRPPHEGDWIEEDDAGHVEEQVAERDLERQGQVCGAG
jgi:hypothetical protein